MSEIATAIIQIIVVMEDLVVTPVTVLNQHVVASVTLLPVPPLLPVVARVPKIIRHHRQHQATAGQQSH